MSDVLVDSSVWVDFLRGDLASVKRVDPLLADGRAAITGPIYAEVISGARHRSVFGRLGLLLRSLDSIAPPAAVWEQVADSRFALARQGTQASLVDLLIAVTALHASHTLLTRDRDFSRIAAVLPVEVEIF
jgi:predicted nucleic acid-binding protein